MARMGVFNRNDNSPTPIPRSLQQLNHRHTTTTRYGQITPVGYWQLLPNETIRIKDTLFLRTVPMVTPQLSRVRVVTRFVAVPNRIMWYRFEDYIKGGIDPTSDLPEEPYIVNFNSLAHFTKAKQTNDAWHDYNWVSTDSYASRAGFIGLIKSHAQSAVDFSLVGIGYERRKGSSFDSTGHAFARQVMFDGTISPWDKTSRVTGDLFGYQFFPHELGDYLNCPLYCTCLGSDLSSRISAFPFACYQLAYSFLYRNPNVQTRVDDYYQMSTKYTDQRFPEYPSFFTNLRVDQGANLSYVPPISTALDNLASDPNFDTYRINPAGIRSSNGYVDAIGDMSKETNSSAVLATSWDKVELFPLKSGANGCMQAVNTLDDTLSFQNTRISLTRIRFANWSSDRFITANPWQQRGDEARIPVFGSVMFDTSQLSFTSTFGGVSSDVTAYDVSIPLHNYSTEQEGYIDEYSGELRSLGSLVQSESSDEYVLKYDVGEWNNEERAGYRIPSGKKIGYVIPSGIVRTTGTGNITGSVSGLYVSPSSFRFAMQLQKIKEMSARTDGRFKSFLSMFYGAKSRDSRLDRPEFIGGFVQDINVSEVEQTTNALSGNPSDVLGTLGAKGVSAKKSSTISFHATEHTMVMALQHIIPDTEYIGGLERTMHTIDPFDWQLPQFAGLSEQPIRMSELCCRPTKFDEVTNTDNDVAFGYEPRFNELRAKHSYVTGAFRDTFNATGSRDYYAPWLITRNFGFETSVDVDNDGDVVGLSYNVPSLSDEFLSMRHTVDNSNFVVNDEDVMYPFISDNYFDVRWTRVVPTRGIPRL